MIRCVTDPSKYSNFDIRIFNYIIVAIFVKHMIAVNCDESDGSCSWSTIICVKCYYVSLLSYISEFLCRNLF